MGGISFQKRGHAFFLLDNFFNGWSLVKIAGICQSRFFDFYPTSTFHHQQDEYHQLLTSICREPVGGGHLLPRDTPTFVGVSKPGQVRVYGTECSRGKCPLFLKTLGTYFKLLFFSE